jgi:GT2 family glycosyltransferase
VGLLDSDDLWKPQKLARQLAALDADPGLGWVSAYAEVVDETNTVVLGCKPTQAPGETLGEMVVQGSAAPSSFLVRREVLSDVGGFDPATAGLDDLDLCLRMARRWRTVCLEEPLIRYRQHAGGMSTDSPKMYRAYLPVYEKLLALPAEEVSPRAVRRRLAKWNYLLGVAHLRWREPVAAVRHLAGAIRFAPLVGLEFVTAGDGWWRRGWLALKPYAALGSVGLALFWPRRVRGTGAGG